MQNKLCVVTFSSHLAVAFRYTSFIIMISDSHAMRTPHPLTPHQPLLTSKQEKGCANGGLLLLSHLLPVSDKQRGKKLLLLQS